MATKVILLKLKPDYVTQLIKHYSKSNITYTKKLKSYNGSWSLCYLAPIIFLTFLLLLLFFLTQLRQSWPYSFLRSIVGTSVIEDFVLVVSCPRMLFTFGKNSLFQVFAQISLWYFEFLATILYFQVVTYFRTLAMVLWWLDYVSLSLNLQLGHFICFG